MSVANLLAAVGHFPAVAGIVAVAMVLAPVLRIWIAQSARTRRFTRALEDTDPGQRAEIIAACGRMEAVSMCEEGNGVASIDNMNVAEILKPVLPYGRRRRRNGT